MACAGCAARGKAIARLVTGKSTIKATTRVLTSTARADLKAAVLKLGLKAK